MYYESEIFFLFSLSIKFMNPKILGFLFSTKKKPNLGSEMQKIKLQKIAGNLLVRQASEIVHGWNGHQ